MKCRLAVYSALAFLIAAVGFHAMHSDAAQWSWYRTVQVEKRPVLDVPYVPTPQNVVNRMLSIAGVNSRDVLYDLGCGDGRVVVTAARDLNVKRAIGVDIDPQRIQESAENARAAGVSDRVAFFQKNLFDVDIREATVVSLYLLPSVNLKLRPKLFQELKPGTRIVSHDFDMGDWLPDRKVQMDEHTVYFWVIPASVHGTWQWTMADGNRETHRYELRLVQHFQNIDSAQLKVDDMPVAVKSVTVSGDRLEFTVEGSSSTRYSGRIEGDRITGSVTSSGKGRSPDSKWTADRDKATALPVHEETPENRIQI